MQLSSPSSPIPLVFAVQV